MLTLVEDDKIKRHIHRALFDNIRSAWPMRERRMVVWRPNSANLNIYHNGLLWFASIQPHSDQKTPRFWNSFGRYQANGGLQITVEANIEVGGNGRRVSGFYAYDQATDSYYLMHDGGVGGGMPGVSRENFLAWSGAELVPVEDSDGGIRHGVIVAPIKSGGIGNNISRFVRVVSEFKAAVRNGEIDIASIENASQTYKDYFSEFSGKKKGRRKREFEYISRHGDIVEALAGWCKTPGRRVKNAYIDLGIEGSRGKLVELYEVKTNSDRQTLYTTIGQILVHEPKGSDVRKFIVLPKSSGIPSDVRETIRRLKINVLVFSIKNDRITISKR